MLVPLGLLVLDVDGELLEPIAPPELSPLLGVMLLPDEPPVDVAPEPESIAPLAGAEPAAPLLESPPAAIAPPAEPVVEEPAVPVEPDVSAGVVVVVDDVEVSSAFLPHAPTLRAAATARMLMAVRMGNPLVGDYRALNRCPRRFVPPFVPRLHRAARRRCR